MIKQPGATSDVSLTRGQVLSLATSHSSNLPPRLRICRGGSKLEDMSSGHVPWRMSNAHGNLAGAPRVH